MRDILSEISVVEVADGRTGDIHEIEYKNPTAADMAAYQAACFIRRGKKVINNQFATRMRWGARIICGFKKGTLSAGGKPIATDPADPDYRKDWKKLLTAHAPDIVAAVAGIAFDGTGRPGDVEFEISGEEEETGGAEDGEGGEEAQHDPFGMKITT